jgi:two-component system response regulator YesN
MRQILIVDDEYIVRLGLKTIIDWPEHGWTINEAANGREALEIFEQKGADVILTDIKMPVMDGLELIRAVREKDKNVKIIILSHYDEFAYAQEAMSLGAFRYILKSDLTKTNLLDIIQSLFWEENAGEDPRVKRKGDAAEERWIKENLFCYFNKSNPNGAMDQMPDAALFQGRWVVLCGSCPATMLLPHARTTFDKTITTLFTEVFPEMVIYGDYLSDDFKFFALVPLLDSQGESQKESDAVYSNCLKIVKNIHQYYDTNLFIGISAQGGAEELCSLSFEAFTALGNCFFSEKDFITIYENNTATIKTVPPPIHYSVLSEMLELNNKKAILEYIQNTFRELRRIKVQSFVRNAFIDFLAIGKSLREKYSLQEKTGVLSDNKFNYEVFSALLFISDVELYIYEIFLALLSGKQSGKTSYSHIVKNSINFIKQNYKKNISLTETAQRLEISHNYLSVIFKQETGINFNTYLTQYRIEQAKELLKTSTMRIYEVAEGVGFSNPYYFSKVFKEYLGMSCKEFRDNAG